MNIGERIKEEREKLGFDQEGFAALGGASRHSQIDWEKGKSFPNAKVLAAYAAAGADVQYILTGVRSNMAAEQHPGYNVLNSRETMLLDNYRHIADEEDKRCVERTALLAAKADKKEGTNG
jgi:transcriptional regulator with XRE-family HTH domain